MFKSGLLFLFIFLPIFGNSQISRFYYELKYKPNQTDTLREKAHFVLDIDNGISIFRDFKTVSQDSLLKKGMQFMKMQSVNKMEDIGVKEPDFSFIIKKTLKNIEYKDKIGADNYEYSEEKNFNWVILSDRKLIFGFSCQKAEVSYGGRIWTAWFTSDIPIQDGPYKFCNLPGLILEIFDENKEYQFTFIGNHKIDSPTYISDEIMGKNYIKVSKASFYESESAFMKDPYGQIYTSIPTKDVEVRQSVEKQRSSIRDWYAKNNNPIEINGNSRQHILLKGLIYDENDKPVKYANIGIIDGTEGTVTDTDGVYILTISSYLENDIIKISSLGFEDLEIPVNNFINQHKKIYRLSRFTKTVNIEEVVLESRKPKTKVLGVKSNSNNIRIGFKNGVLGQEIGILIKNKNKIKLQKLNVNILESSFTNTPFRINIYKINPDGNYQNILEDNIILNINSNDDFKTKSLDLSEYKLILEGDFLITLELLDNKENGELYFSGSIFSKGLMRKTSQSKFVETTINPSINIDVSILK